MNGSYSPSSLVEQEPKTDSNSTQLTSSESCCVHKEEAGAIQIIGHTSVVLHIETEYVNKPHAFHPYHFFSILVVDYLKKNTVLLRYN